MKYLIFSIFLFVILISKDASSQEKWVLLDKGNKFEIYYDSLNINTSSSISGTTSFKLKMIFNKPSYIEDIKKTAEYIILEAELNCGQNTISSSSSTLYFTDGTSKVSNEKMESKAADKTPYTRKLNEIFCK